MHNAQQRAFCDTRTGKSIGRAITDSQGSTTVYDAAERVTGRTATDSSGITTIYDANGRYVGNVTTTRTQSR